MATDTDQEDYQAQRGVEVARRVMARRNRQMSAAEERLFLRIKEVARAIEVRPASDKK